MDLFADALWKLYETGHVRVEIERDDGHRDSEDISWYLMNYASFPKYEKQALKFARGRVLDIGCGGGRHSLYLQRRGLTVTAIDASQRIVDLARRRGVKDVRLVDACGRLPFHDGEFDSVLLFGNNLGICGTVARFRRMVRELHRVTSPRGRILATTRMPSTTKPKHRAYLKRNVGHRRAVGQIRLRLIFRGKRGTWFDLLLLSPTDLQQIGGKEGWELTHVFTETDLEELYSVVMEKG